MAAAGLLAASAASPAAAEALDPRSLSGADMALIQNILEYERTDVPRDLPSRGRFRITETSTNPRICREFTLTAASGARLEGAGCRVADRQWALGTAPETVPTSLPAGAPAAGATRPDRSQTPVRGVETVIAAAEPPPADAPRPDHLPLPDRKPGNDAVTLLAAADSAGMAVLTVAAVPPDLATLPVPRARPPVPEGTGDAGVEAELDASDASDIALADAGTEVVLTAAELAAIPRPGHRPEPPALLVASASADVTPVTEVAAAMLPSEAPDDVMLRMKLAFDSVAGADSAGPDVLMAGAPLMPETLVASAEGAGVDAPGPVPPRILASPPVPDRDGERPVVQPVRSVPMRLEITPAVLRLPLNVVPAAAQPPVAIEVRPIAEAPFVPPLPRRRPGDPTAGQTAELVETGGQSGPELPADDVPSRPAG